MCNCSKNKGTGKRYVVTYANGSTADASSLVDAKLKASKSAGATYAEAAPVAAK